MRAFNFGGVSSREFGVGISGSGTFDAPERDVEVIDIPGRNGALIQDNGRFKNIDVTYPAWMHRDFDEWFPRFKSAMQQFTGYQILTDEYDTEHFREAIFTGAMQPYTGVYNKSGKFDVVFNCKPQRFLFSGAKELTFLPVTGTQTGAMVSGIEVTPGTRFKVSGRFQSSGTVTVKYYNASSTAIKTETATGSVISYSGTVPANAATASVEYPTDFESYVSINNNGTETCYTDTGLVLMNPTPYTARPVISIYDGEDNTFYALTVNREMQTKSTLSITLADYTTDYSVNHVTIDSTLQDCYYDGLVGLLPMVVNMNPYVVITENGNIAHDFPVIEGGSGLVIPTANVSKIVIKPGWWEV